MALVAKDDLEEIVTVNDPEEEPEEEETEEKEEKEGGGGEEEEEEEDEDELIDPQETIREECRNTENCQALINGILAECTKRVEGGAEEMCHEEMTDVYKCIDRCAWERVWATLK